MGLSDASQNNNLAGKTASNQTQRGVFKHPLRYYGRSQLIDAGQFALNYGKKKMLGVTPI